MALRYQSRASGPAAPGSLGRTALLRGFGVTVDRDHLASDGSAVWAGEQQHQRGDVAGIDELLDRFTSTTALQSSKESSSAGAVAPPMPALLMRTSSPPRWSSRSLNRRSTVSGSLTSVTEPLMFSFPSTASAQHRHQCHRCGPSRRRQEGFGDREPDAAGTGCDENPLGHDASPSVRTRWGVPDRTGM